jgi:hypothetical protein
MTRSGNQENLGLNRNEELYLSYDVLGVDEKDVEILDDP